MKPSRRPLLTNVLLPVLAGIILESGCRVNPAVDDTAAKELGTQKTVQSSESLVQADSSTADKGELNLLFYGCSLTVMETAGFKGTIRNAATSAILSGAKIEIYPSRYKPSGIVYTNASGKYVTVPALSFCKVGDYAWVCASSPNFQSQCRKVSASLNPIYQIDLALAPVTPTLPKGRCKYSLEYAWQTTEGGCKKLEGNPLVFSASSTVTMPWLSAKSYCDALTESGFSDWRLPATAELTAASSGFSILYFAFAPNNFWSSVEGPTSRFVKVATNAYIENLYIPLKKSKDRLRSKSEKYPVVCVRN